MLAIFLSLILSPIVGATDFKHDARYDVAIETLRARVANAGLALAVVSGEEIKHVGLYGHADVAGQTALQANTLFMIGSTTKAMTATLAVMAANRSPNLTLETPAQRILPAFTLVDPVAAAQTNLRDLLSHRTGVPRHDLLWMSKGLDTAGNVGLFGQMEPSAPFRSKFQYQNLGFVVAGEIAAAELGVSWASGIRDYLFAPLGMDGARAISSDVLPTDLVALPHAGDGETSIAPRNIDAAGACGSVYASIADMSKWVQFNLQNSRAKPSAFADLYQPQIEISPPAPEFPEIGAMHYGLGWAVSSYRGHRLIWHNGGIDGYASQVLFFPDLNLGFVVLTNGGALDPSIVGYTVADVALGVEGTDWLTRFESPPSPSFPADKEFPTSYAAAIGEYTHPVYGRLNVTVKEIEGEYYVAAELNHGIELGFVPWIESPTEWLHDHGRWYASFRFASEGALVETVAINLEPAVAPIQFVRVR